MNPSSTTSETRPRHVARYVVLTFVGIAVVAVGSLYLIVRTKAANAEREAIALGPTTFEELEARRRKWPEGQDAGPAFLLLADKLKALRNLAQEEEAAPKTLIIPDLPSVGELWTPEVRDQVRAYVAGEAELYGQLDELRRYPGGTLPLDLTPDPSGVNLLMPDLGSIRSAVKLECLAILNEAMAGQPSRLAARLEVIDRIRSLIEDQPTLFSALVTVASDSLLCQSIEGALNLDGVEPAALPVVEASLRHRLNYSLKPALLGERASFMKTQSLKNTRKFPFVSLLFDADIAYGTRLYNRLVAAADDMQKLRIQAQEVGRVADNAPGWALMTTMFLPSIERGVQLTINSQAQVQATRLGIAIERFRIENKRFPERAAELVPKYLNEVPLDPFDGKPVRYQRTAKGAIAYSIGINGIDDGGSKPDKGIDAGDVVFTVLAPEFRRQPPAVPTSKPEGR